ncbi:MAG TPA: response regulator [Leptospiraceae bacterium]|nr:response regulator [Leptospiraceae bacterium]HNJ05096.1 response regulator [Leptospiraceae bacterium]HNL01864.1 response regulator [Leptospiraceae bacterium]HNL70299.1 response regulator [Leptospiraceae bacterium]HQI18673.1 response regulator [Leptospiraceae bacterium]
MGPLFLMALIVIIDSDLTQARALEGALAGLRHRILATQSAARGIELAQSGNPDLILLNPENSQMDGIQILASLRKDPITKEIAVALVQRQPDAALLPRLRQLGVVDTISPGLTQDLLRKKILQSLVLAEKHKLDHNLKRANHIHVRRTPGRTDISILSGLKEFSFQEAKTVLNPFFVRLTKNDSMVLDIRAIPNINETELPLLQQIIDLVANEKLILIAGRHLGLLIAETEIGETVPTFFTQEEAEQHLSAR